MKRYFFILVTLLQCVPAASAMSVDEAYRTIPHRQTDFVPDTAGMNQADQAYLEFFFDQINQAIVERVVALRWLFSSGDDDGTYEAYQAAIDAVLVELRQRKPPPSLEGARRQVIEAIESQSRYVEAWMAKIQAGETFRFIASDPSIQDSHRKLLAAYGLLMKYYPQASRNNKQAFFDHLCALDFI